MKIRKMNASFGMLQNNNLELGQGLNIVYAPNESGKSTWCGFIKSMLYGVDSTARERGGVKPDKVRFAPWSGAPMSGTMDIEYEGGSITLSRQGRETAPMRDFTATFSGSSNPVRSLDPMSVGETLLGVSRDVFERSAFIGQGKVTVAGSPELEKRIAAIVQTGEEKSSVTQAEERLRAAARKRRYNKSGRLPEIEREIDEIRENLTEGAREAQRGEELKKAKAYALQRRDELQAKVSELRKDTRRDTLERLSESRGNIRELENAYNGSYERFGAAERKLDSGVFERQDPRESRSRFEADAAALHKLDEGAKKGGGALLNYVILAVLLLAAIAFELLADFDILRASGFAAYLPRIAAGALALAQFVRLLTLRQRRKRLSDQKHDILAQYGAESELQVLEILACHERDYSEYVAAAKDKSGAAEKLEAAKAKQSELEAALLKDLDFADGGSAAVQYTKLLEEAENALRNIREESALWEGRQSVLKDPEEQQARLTQLAAEHERLTREYEALALALDTLKDAGDEISRRITPRLSSRAAEIFSKLTADRYSSLLLDRELKASARAQDDTVARDVSFLSAGAVDQLYLAVRLAICELALPAEKKCPIILDDALVNFDDERCKLALELLREMSQERQIVLFTCHGREAALMKNCPDVRITVL